MSEQLTPINKQELLSLVINELAQNPVLREQLCQKLLLGLHNNGVENQQEDNSIITESDETAQSTSDFIQRIFEDIDWDTFVNNTYGQDVFFNGTDGIYTSLGNALRTIMVERNNYKTIDINETNWSNHYWNDSLARLMQLLYQHIDPSGVQIYENSGLLIELIDNDGTIDTTHLRGSLAPNGGETKLAALRIVDIMQADAGNSFEPMTDLYWYGFFYEYGLISYGNTEVYLNNVLFIEEADRIIAAMEKGDEVSRKDLDKIFKTVDEGGYIYSGTIIGQHPLPATSITTTITGVKKKFKVIKNPWVVPWYNIDGDTYRKVRGEDIKVSALTDPSKLGFTQVKGGRWIRLLMPQYKRRVEVEDLNRNFWVIGQVIAGISIYLFDENSPLMKMLKGLIEEIGQLWENMIYLWTALAILSQKKFYNVTHSEVVMLSLDSLVPYERFDNFDAAATIESVKQHLNYLVQMYPEENLAVLPFIRDNNYEHNYYGAVWYPGIFIYNRNVASPEWSLIGFYSTSPNPYFTTTGFYIALGDFADSIYGIHENEETYDYIIPLSNTGEIITENDIRYYGLARDFITFDASVIESVKSINVSIKLTDLGKALIDESQEESIIFNYEAHYNQGIMVIDNFALNNDDIEPEDGGTIKIKKGYYQGELLSTCEDIDKIIYDIYVLPSVNLPPVTTSRDDIIQNYKEPAYETLRDEDSAVLEKVLDNYCEYHVNPSGFWTEERQEYFTSPSYFYSLSGGLSQSKIRASTTKNLVDTTLVYPSIDDWETDNNNYYSSGGDRNLEKTILFVEGVRDTNYSSRTDVDAETRKYFPYAADVDGFKMPYVQNTSVLTAQTGAKISLPLPQGEGRATSFYDAHTSISSGGPSFLTANAYVPKIGGLCQSRSDRALIPADQLDATLVDDVYRETSDRAGGQEQWLVSIKEGQKTITLDNWLVTKVSQGRTDLIKFFNESGGNITSFNNFEKYCYSVSNVGTDRFNMQIARGYAVSVYNDLEAADRTVRNISSAIQTFFNNNNIVNSEGNDYPSDWYKDQAIMYGLYDDWYTQQCRIYNDASKVGEWTIRINNLEEARGETYENYSSYGVSDPQGNSFVNRRFLNGLMTTDTCIFVFGPDGTYARRVYGRDAQGHYTSEFMRDEEADGGNVNALREGYVVISNNAPSENYEKYKSKGHLKMMDGGGFYTPSDDDDYFNDYNIMWQDAGVIPPWDIPR